jgi:hypothetical protein
MEERRNGVNTTMNLALNTLYQSEIVSREQLLNEMLRVKMTLNKLEDKPSSKKSKDKLFQLMKTTTEEELGLFQYDKDDFIDIFDTLKDINLIQFTLEIFKNDRLGTVISPDYLTSYISNRIKELKPKTILITEAEKHLPGLQELIIVNSDCNFTFTTQLKQMHLFLNLAFGEYENVKIVFESIYTDCLIDEKFDYIYSLPTFGIKPDEINKTFFTKDSDGIAMENMLTHLEDNGVLDAIIPAKITFAGLGYEKLRKHIVTNYGIDSIYILPEGTFRPTTSVKTYLFTITKKPKEDIEIGTLKLVKEIFTKTEKKQIPKNIFLSYDDWRIEILLSEDDENIQKFNTSNIGKVKLKDVAEVFRGKSILKKDTTLGDISILNISNIENGEIDYVDMDTIKQEERKIKRYELFDKDVVLSCRGTSIKTAVFEKQEKTIIASANLIVIRPKEKLKSEYIKIFFESPIGLAIIKSFQRGTTVMNINHSDIMEMEIPLIPMPEQKEMINKYNIEFSEYKKTITEAETRWSKVKNSLYNKLT